MAVVASSNVYPIVDFPPAIIVRALFSVLKANINTVCYIEGPDGGYLSQNHFFPAE